MANASTAKKAAEAKAANKKAEKDAAKKDEAPAEEPKATVKRTSARITLTQTKVIEEQFDTQSKRIEALDEKLIGVIKGYEDKPEHMVAQKAEAAREQLKVAAEAIVAAKDEFAEIGEALRDFFAY